MKSIRDKRLTGFMLALWSIVILVLTVYPSIESPVSQITYIDKIAHFSQFFIFSLLFIHCRLVRNDDVNQIITKLSLIALPLSLIPEVLQLFVQGRTFCLHDAFANLLGFIAGIIYIVIRKRNIETKLVCNDKVER
jgi:VanZ family protein